MSRKKNPDQKGKEIWKKCDYILDWKEKNFDSLLNIRKWPRVSSTVQYNLFRQVIRHVHSIQ